MNNIKISKWFLLYFLIIAINPLLFKLSVWLFLIVFFHEFMHMMMAKILGYKIESVMIYPFGMSIKVKEIEYMNLIHEALIVIVGPLSHLFMLFVLKYCLQYHLLSFAFYDYLKMVNLSMMIFNSLPIYPLDGGRLLQVLFQCFFTYQKANVYVYYFSFISMIIMMIFLHHVMIFMIGLHLLIQNYRWKQQLSYQTICFYDYRLEHPIRFPIIFHEQNDLYRGCMNVICVNDSYLYENQYLKWKLHR